MEIEKNELISKEEVSNEEEESEEDESNNNENDILTPFESKLGNKEYWDKFYSKEIKQFKNNSDLIGEVWFGEHVQNKVVNYIKEQFKDRSLKVLDVGCGNAALILELSKIGFNNLNGMDYSDKSIEFAKEILKEKFEEENINYTVNLYSEDISNPKYNGEYSLIHDKGTFDAYMSMKNHTVNTYIDFIKKNSLSGTTFILTSCNYSTTELHKFFLYQGSRFKLLGDIPHKSFSFGGSAGQVVTTLIFIII